MRYFASLLAATLLLSFTSPISLAQDEDLQRTYDRIDQEYQDTVRQYSSGQQSMYNDANTYNDQADDLWSRRKAVGSKIEFLNNLPDTREAYEKGRTDLSQKWSQQYGQGGSLTMDENAPRPRYDAAGNRVDLPRDSSGRLIGGNETTGGGAQFGDNVVSLRYRTPYDAGVDAERQRLGAGDTSGRRIREINPYDGTEYTRYYDEQGKLKLAAWKNEADGLQRAIGDFNQSYKRASDLKDGVDRQYDQQVQKYNNVQTTQQKLTTALQELQRAQAAAAQAQADAAAAQVQADAAAARPSSRGGGMPNVLP